MQNLISKVMVPLGCVPACPGGGRPRGGVRVLLGPGIVWRLSLRAGQVAPVMRACRAARDGAAQFPWSTTETGPRTSEDRLKSSLWTPRFNPTYPRHLHAGHKYRLASFLANTIHDPSGKQPAKAQQRSSKAPAWQVPSLQVSGLMGPVPRQAGPCFPGGRIPNSTYPHSWKS